MVPKPERVLFLSDAHIGAEISNFDAYREKIIGLMAQYDHVVMNGDMFELFYVGKDHVNSFSKLLETLTNKDKKYWKKEFDIADGPKQCALNIIRGAQWFITAFLDKFPHIKLHVVCGNHESIRRFRREFQKIQETHSNFEFSEEAIRIGDALVTHGHLPLSGCIDAQYPLVRLREAETKRQWTDILGRIEKPGYAIIQAARSPFIASRKIHGWLQYWDEHNTGFGVSHNRVHAPFRMAWVKHVFFGHTHVKFDKGLA